MPRVNSPHLLLPLLLLLVVAAAGCDGSWRNRRFYKEIVDCTDLPALPSRYADASAVSETLLSDLGAGRARLVLRWKDADGEGSFLTAETSAYIMRALNGVSWAVGVDLPCTPDARAHIHFTPSDVVDVVPGEYPITAFGFDVPDLEQGNDEPTTEMDGTITITSSSSERASGFMSGSARTTLKSHVTQENLGIEAEVSALAFHAIDWFE